METPKSVALFLASLSAGGAERVMLNLAEGMLARGLRIDIVVTRAQGDFQKKIPAQAYLVNLGAARTLMAIPALTHYLGSRRPDLLVSAVSHNNLIALLCGALTGTRVAVTEHGMLSLGTHLSPNKREKLVPLLIHLFYPLAHKIIAVSHAGAEDLAATARLPRRGINVIHNPLIGSDIASSVGASLEHPWFIKGQPPVIIAVGRLVPEKSFDTLIRAFAILHQQRPARLMILGEGALRSSLETLARQLGIQEHVAMPGYDDNPFRYMARCGVFALSSAWEGFGNVLVEALACGAQVVSTNCPGGPAEILNNGEFGRLVPVGDAAALAAALAEALDQPMPREKLIARAQDFSIDKITAEYLRVLFPEVA